MSWPRRILVGVDGSEPSADALAFARLLATQTGATLTVACVHGSARAFHSIGTEAQARQAVDSVAAAAALGEEATVRLVPAGSPAEGLRQLAMEEEADLLVLGHSRRSGPERRVPGAVARNLIHWGHRAVAVAPPGFAGRDDAGLRVTGVGLDGSPESLAALVRAESLALAAGGALRVYCVLPEPGQHEDGMTTTARSRLITTLDESTRGLAPEVRALPVTLTGPAWSELVEHSEEVELFVVGTHGYGALRRAVLGSVAEAVLCRAACPVIVVPRQVAAEMPTGLASRESRSAAG